METIYRNPEINLVVNLEKSTLIVAPTRWGKTFELARIGRWAYKQGYFPLFLTSNLTSLSADWDDKHTSLNHKCNENFETIVLNKDGLATLIERFRTPVDHPQLYGSHRFSKWVEMFPNVATMVDEVWQLKPIIL